ncbi:hypothetical protein [Novosphingobium sp.]|jgi:hypothetical protein|uniref:hypothetical protein n=1 Tax=Novosphingobium sp. TaxID=1874826 RepID=UPI00352A7166
MADNEHNTDEHYMASLKNAEWTAVIFRNNMGFRFGPYSAEEVGAIMSQCVEEGIPLTITANCGRDFDWDIARDFGRGVQANWRPMGDAPKDGSVVMGDVGGFEQRMCWWENWQVWRRVADNNTDVGEPVSPYRWRPLEDDDRTEVLSPIR